MNVKNCLKPFVSFAPSNEGEDREEPFSPDTLNVGVIVQQQGSGLDCHAVYLKFKDHPMVKADYMTNSNLRQAAAVREVIGVADQSMRIGGYSIEGVGDSYEDSYGGDTEMIYEPRAVDFRANRFEDAKKAVMRSMQGRKVSARQTLPHKKSQYHNFAKRNREDVQYDWDRAEKQRQTVDQPDDKLPAK